MATPAKNLFCEVIDCPETPTHNKPYCTKHILMMQYPAQVRKAIEEDPSLLGDWLKKPPRWTPEERAAIDAWKGKLRIARTKALTAIAHGTPIVEATRQYNTEMGTSRALVQDVFHKIVAMVENNVSVGTVAKKFHIPPDIVTALVSVNQQRIESRFSPAEYAQTLRRVMAGEDKELLAKELGVSRNYLNIMVRRLLKRIYAKIQAGDHPLMIASAFQLPEDIVDHVIEMAQSIQPRKVFDAQTKAIIVARLSAGESRVTIAKDFNTTASHIGQIGKRLGLGDLGVSRKPPGRPRTGT